MFGLIYLLVCVFTGYAILIWVMPEIFSGTNTSFKKKEIDVSPMLLWIPAIIMTGILLVTWSVYLLANLFRTQESPLLYANILAMVFYTVLSTILVVWKKKKGTYIKPVLFTEKKNARYGEMFFFTIDLFVCITGYVGYFLCG